MEVDACRCEWMGKTTSTYTVKIQIPMKMKNAKLCYVRNVRKMRVAEDLFTDAPRHSREVDV